MPRFRLLVVLVALSLFVGVGSVFASTIVGGPRGETLRGTPRQDRLYGKAGNDILLGLGGNDVLVGGPGADRLLCGPGRDVAWADARDKVAKDCETVKGRPQPPLPTMPGRYCGATSQDLVVCLDVKQVGSVEQLSVRASVKAPCQPTGDVGFSVETFFVPVGNDRSFSRTLILAGYSARISGTFAASRDTAGGTLDAQYAYDRSGVHYECESGVVSWAARTPPPPVTAQAGSFCGFTDQGSGLCFDVAGEPKTVSNFALVVKTECTPPTTLGVSSTIPDVHVIREDNTFALDRTGSGTTPAGGSFTITHSLKGAFDTSGTKASGTLTAHLSYTAADGTHYVCDSGTFGWNATRQP